MCGIMANLILNFRNKDVENIYMEICQNEFGLAPRQIAHLSNISYSVINCCFT